MSQQPPGPEKSLSRRQALRLGTLALLGSAVSNPLLAKIALPPARTQRIFFEPMDTPRIRSNARTILLGTQYRKWARDVPASMFATWERFRESNNYVSDLNRFWAEFTNTAMVQLVEPRDDLRDALIEMIENIVALPRWDYLMDGDTPIGLMRASMATSRLLFAREVLYKDLSDDLQQRLLDSMAEKAAEPCYRAIYGMDNPDSVTGWRYDPDEGPTPFNMDRWPILLGSNNLRGAPTMGLGLAALALEGHDPRAGRWLKAAESSAMTVFKLFHPDGSYFEGLSYAAYTYRTMLQFCAAHRRIKGTIDWSRQMNFDGQLDYMIALQCGRNADGTPDIINFSDAPSSYYAMVPAWLEAETGNPVAQYAAEHFSHPAFFVDYLWYRPGRPREAPRVELQNYRNELDWVVSRSGWRPEDAVLAFRGGFPANHEHADRNSFLYKIFGERLLTDHYGAAYSNRSPGWTLRLTEAHNAILINGEGHQYHDGSEGVNEGQAIARIVRYEDRGQRIWWCSDATQAYQLVNPAVKQVLRTVAFVKPNIIVLLDQVRLDDSNGEVEVRFFPDNRDQAALLSTGGDRFLIERPNAVLYGASACNAQLKVARHKLDLISSIPNPPDEPISQAEAEEQFGQFPFIGVQSSGGSEHSVVTVLVARKDGDEGTLPRISIAPNERGWFFEAEDIRGVFDTQSSLPELIW
ncbi:MAG: heparinase II/III family protein [Opitutales bacterium]|nr:heparinase II/III family protein [Opitutales bacterium]